MSINLTLGSFFAVFNFALFCVLVSYLFKKLLKAPLQEAVEQHAEIIPSLYHDISSAQKTLANLQTTADQQRLTIGDLSHKLGIWRSTIDSHNQALMHEQQAAQATLAKKITLQSQNYAAAYYKNKIAPIALAESQTLLRDQFASKAAQETYISALFSSLKKGNR